MILTVRDDENRYRINCSGQWEVRRDDRGRDHLIVPAPEFGGSICLFDHFLIEAARAGEFGLTLISEERLRR
jgi:hypothetical protein